MFYHNYWICFTNYSMALYILYSSDLCSFILLPIPRPLNQGFFFCTNLLFPAKFTISKSINLLSLSVPLHNQHYTCSFKPEVSLLLLLLLLLLILLLFISLLMLLSAGLGLCFSLGYKTCYLVIKLL